MQSRQVHMMGTVIQLSVQHDYASFVLDELIHKLQTYEKRFSAHDPTSELMAINQNAGIRAVKVHPHLYELIKIGKQHSSAKASSLNIAIGPLVKAWRIGFKDAHIPPEQDIQALLTKTNVHDIVLHDAEQTVFLKHAGMFIDLGALAKGFIADRLIDDLKAMNASAAIINLGGNVMTYGDSPHHKDYCFRVGIQHPFLPRGNSIAIVKAHNQSVVTSGIYERKFSMNGKTYHHILDPHTGYPMHTEVAGLTIVSNKSIDGEIWTARLFGKRPGEIIDTLNDFQHIAGIVITKDGELHYSESLKPHLIEAVS